MKLIEIRKRAERLGITAGKMRRKSEIIRAIQVAEGHLPSFGENSGNCPYDDCCWWDDCLKEYRRTNGK